MPPPKPKTLQMRGPFDARKGGEQTYNKLELEKLKRSKWLPSLPGEFFKKTPQVTHNIRNQGVFEAIKNRLAMDFHPPILLEEHIVHSWEKIMTLGDFLPIIAHRNTLNGIDFIVEDREKLLTAIRNAMADYKPAFVEANKTKSDWNKHWALAVSLLATNGIGFREIFRPKLSDLPIENNKTVPFDSRLGTDVTVDVSALHLAVSDFPGLKHTRCNIHIDNLTVILGGIGNDVRISPTVITHFVNELILKTMLQGKLPDWIIDAFDISLLNPNEGFLSAGIGATIINKPNFKWTIKYMAGLNNNTNPEWSGSFKFEHSVGTSLVVKF